MVTGNSEWGCSWCFVKVLTLQEKASNDVLAPIAAPNSSQKSVYSPHLSQRFIFNTFKDLFFCKASFNTKTSFLWIPLSWRTTVNTTFVIVMILLNKSNVLINPSAWGFGFLPNLRKMAPIASHLSPYCPTGWLMMAKIRFQEYKTERSRNWRCALLCKASPSNLTVLSAKRLLWTEPDC